jgi:hypothetical protein
MYGSPKKISKSMLNDCPAATEVEPMAKSEAAVVLALIPFMPNNTHQRRKA